MNQERFPSLFVSSQAAPVMLLERDAYTFVNQLQRLVQILPDERGAQHFVPVERLLPGEAECAGVKITLQYATELAQVNIRVRRIKDVEQHALLHRREV